MGRSPVTISDEKLITPSALAEFQRRRLRAIVFHALLTLMLVIMLICARELFQKYTMLAEQLDLAVYSWLQLRLASKLDIKKIPIAIVDISDLETAAIQGARKGEKATPREPLRKFIEQLANEMEPRAIGVDIDFAPVNGVYVTPDDPKFFKSLQKLQEDTGVPIYLGINRTQALPRSQWLLDPDYQLLAASILAPRRDTRKMLKCFQLHQQSECGPSMSEALAQHLHALPTPRFLEVFSRLFVRVIPQEISDSISVGAFPMDYSPLEELMKNAPSGTASQVHTINAAVLTEQGNREIICKRVVLIGDANPDVAADKFIAPGRPEPVPGVYLHACAVYTLAQGPLYLPTWLGRFVMDLALAGFVIIVLTLIRLYFARTTIKVAPDWCEGVLILVAVLVTFGVSAGLVHVTRLLWSDFLLVVFSLMLHPSVERYLPSCVERYLERYLYPSMERFLFPWVERYLFPWMERYLYPPMERYLFPWACK